MIFKSATIFRLPPGQQLDAQKVEQALAAAAFVPCTATQDHAIGFVPPREGNGAFLEAVAGQWIARAMIETKTVPGPVVRKKADEAAAQIEATTGRKPGRKEMKQLREDALMALLPAAFPKQLAVTIWIDRAAGLLVLDTASQARADDVVSLLVRAIDGLALSLPQTKVTPVSAMVQWLTAEAAFEWPDGFCVERECELCSTDEEKAAVRFTRHNLVTDEVRRHIAEGKLPTRLALSWEGRLAFVLTDAGCLKKIQFLDGAFDGRDDDDGFDADVAIATGELGKMIPALFDAMGGLLQQEGGAA